MGCFINYKNKAIKITLHICLVGYKSQMEKSKGKSVQQFLLENFPFLLQTQVLKCGHWLEKD